MEECLRLSYPNNEYRSAGINKYFCESKGTHFITKEDIEWCDLIVYAEDIHKMVVHMKFDNAKLEAMEKMKRSVVLNCGEYNGKCIGCHWLDDAMEKLRPYML